MSDEKKKESAFTSYAKGHMWGLGGIMSSDNPMSATFGAMDRDREQRERERANANAQALFAANTKRERDAWAAKHPRAGRGAGLVFAVFFAVLAILCGLYSLQDPTTAYFHPDSSTMGYVLARIGFFVFGGSSLFTYVSSRS